VDEWTRRSLGFARDDKGERGALSQHWFVDEGTADPSASLGMTKGMVAFPSCPLTNLRVPHYAVVAGKDKLQAPPLRDAPVGMTLVVGLFGARWQG
jgi:hypothetical protein